MFFYFDQYYGVNTVSIFTIIFFLFSDFVHRFSRWLAPEGGTTRDRYDYIVIIMFTGHGTFCTSFLFRRASSLVFSHLYDRKIIFLYIENKLV